MTGGYTALRERCAWLDLSGRGIVIATGRDRTRFLHNLTTNHIKGLTPGAGCYAFLLNPQGRIQCDAGILCLEDRFLLDTEPETRERLLQHLRKYIIADQVKLEDLSGEMPAVGIEGPQSAGALETMGLPVPMDDYGHAPWETGIVARIAATGQPGFRVFTTDRAALVDRIAKAGIPAATAEDARVVRLENGKPRYSEDIFDTTLPQETRQLHAIHFQKGCYLGQEIVERIRARGHVNKLLVPVEIAGQPPPAGTKMGEAAELTAAVLSPALGKTVGLAYVRRQYATPGTEVAPGVVVRPYAETPAPTEAR